VATRQTKSASRRRSQAPAPPRGPSAFSQFKTTIVANKRVLLDIGAVLCLIGGVICGLAVAFPTGWATGPVHHWLTLVLGWTAFLTPLWLLGLGVLRLATSLRGDGPTPAIQMLGGVLASLALPAIVHLLPLGAEDPTVRAFEEHAGGGAFGLFLSDGLVDALGFPAAVVLLAGGFGLGLILLFDLTVTQVGIWIGIVLVVMARATGGLLDRVVVKVREKLAERRLKVKRVGQPQTKPLAGALSQVVRKARPSAKKNRDEEDGQQGDEVQAELELQPSIPGRPGSQLWRLPAVTLFKTAPTVEISQTDVRAQAKTIEETLASFNISARVIEVSSGPTVTQFGLEPSPGVAVNKILARQHDLSLRLGASALRLEAPVPGRRVVGIEVPNRSGQTVSLRELFESDPWMKSRSKLRLALGRDVSGEAVVGDLAKMPHLLIAGATGSGKSVCINTIVASLIYQCTPDDLQFVMVDPKMVELVGFNGIPHLRMPVVTDMETVVGVLKWVVKEMERRYGLLAARSARNIEAYNKAIENDPSQKKMPFLVVVIDELADMMMIAGDEVERLICRLAQLARAAGIHLVVATQRPSVDVITGLIKANIPTRISFAVSSHIDSRTILDTAGAEKLLGRGDMLYLPQDAGKPVRLQGAFVGDDEMKSLVDFWTRLGRPSYTDDDMKQVEALNAKEDDDGDDLFEKAVAVAVQYRKVSASLLQRRLGIGYPRAARLVDLLEERGVIGPSEDGRSRELLEVAEPLGID
jgi:S-DNA-T family DNA segregation ATPase FtsK/SpoIIIE